MHIYFTWNKTPSLRKKIKYACMYILTRVNTIIKQKNKYACIYNKHAQNYTKYTQNGAFTNSTPYKTAMQNFDCLLVEHDERIEVADSTVCRILAGALEEFLYTPLTIKILF